MPGGPIIPPSGLGPYPSVEDVLNLVRVHLNDTQAGATGTPGEGRIFTDGAPFVLPLLNTCIGELQRRLQNQSVTTKIADVFIFNIPPINSTSGVGSPNTAAFQTLSYSGFWDGLVSLPAPPGTIFLPPDLLVPLIVKQRQSGSGLQFTEVPIAEEGLPSIYQNNSLGQWEFRGDAIYWNGCIQMQDIEIRYLQAAAYFPSGTSPSTFKKTPIPIRDCVQALSYMIAEEFMEARLPPGATNPLTAKSDKAVFDMANRYTRANQNKVYTRREFGEDGGGHNAPGGWW